MFPAFPKTRRGAFSRRPGMDLELLEQRMLLASTLSADTPALVTSLKSVPAAISNTSPQATSQWVVMADLSWKHGLTLLFSGGFAGVTQANQAPRANFDAVAAPRVLTTELRLLTNDSEPDGDPLRFSSVPTRSAHGSLAFKPGSADVLLYTPDSGYMGTDTFRYTITDGRGAYSSATVNLQIFNRAPVVYADAARTTQGQSVTLTVLSNDYDPEGDRITLLDFQQPAHGTVTRRTDNPALLTYTPAAGFAGQDVFNYRVSDGLGGITSGQVAVIVTASVPTGNRLPVANNDQATLLQNQSVWVGVLANDTDADRDPITLTEFTQPSNGLVRRDGSKLVYTPRTGFIGQDTFRYTISDGKGTSSASVTLTVLAASNRVPDAVDDRVNTSPSTRVTVPVLANDRDPDGDPLQLTAWVQPANGQIWREGTSLVYSPRAGFSGSDLFTYTISDGRGGTDTASVFVTVNAPATNRAPVANSDATTTRPGRAVTVDVLANDSDPDGDRLQMGGIARSPVNGSAWIDSGRIVYTPRAGFTGVDTVAYIVHDGRLGRSLGTLTVRVVNAAPVAVADNASTRPGQAVTLSPLSNDRDPDGDSFTLVAFTNPTGGTVRQEGSRLVFVPDSRFVGTARMDYTIADSFGARSTGTILVTVGNRAPIATPDLGTVHSGSTIRLNVLGNDSDPDGDRITLSTFATSTARGGRVRLDAGALVYTAPVGFTGTDAFTYSVIDPYGLRGSATVTLQVVNTAPNAVNDEALTRRNETISINVLGNDSDPDGDTFRILQVASTSVTLGQVTLDPQNPGQVIYTPRSRFQGVDSFTYTLVDAHGARSTGTVTVTVGLLPGDPLPGPEEHDWTDFNRDGEGDLVYINRTGASGWTEVHVLAGQVDGPWQTFLSHTSTALPHVDADWSFQVLDFNHDGTLDLAAFDPTATTGMVDVVVLDGSTAFQTALLTTSVGTVGEDATGQVSLRSTLSGVQLVLVRPVGGSGNIEVETWTLDGSVPPMSSVQLTAGTATDGAYSFAWGDQDGDGLLDLWAIKGAGASGMTEVTIYNAADGFQTTLYSGATAFHAVGAETEFQVSDLDGDGKLDLYCIETAPGTNNPVLMTVLAGTGSGGPFQNILTQVTTGVTGGDGGSFNA